MDQDNEVKLRKL